MAPQAVDVRRFLRAAAYCVLLLATTAVAAVQGPIEHTGTGRLGKLRLYHGAAVHDLVFLFSDGAWSAEDDATARELAALGAVVAGVDLKHYESRLAASDDGCHYLLSEIEEESHRLQRKFRFDGYRWPILAGVGEGGALAYAALAQSPFATVAGAAAVDRAAVLHTRVPICAGAKWTAAPGGGFSYAKKESLPGWWLEGHEELPSARERRAGLVSLLRSQLAPRKLSGKPLADLPLTVIAAQGTPEIAVVIYSGDGGWRDIDKQIGEFLASQGVPVIGVDSLRYFWHEKQPEQMAADLSRILRFYADQWHVSHFALVGYSFGADVLPFIVNRLPAVDRARIAVISLLGLEAKASFQITVTGWLGMSKATDNPVLPEIRKLDPTRVQCFLGEEETDSLCRSHELQSTEVIETKGGHHFGGGYQALAEKILSGARRRLQAKTPSPAP
jgi:type IV secretory pathway VirJ component